jgi:hypothetical protein
MCWQEDWEKGGSGDWVRDPKVGNWLWAGGQQGWKFLSIYKELAFQVRGIFKHEIFIDTIHATINKTLKDILGQMRMTGVADIVYVNIVTWTVGCERVGGLANGGAVVGRPETRVDGYLPSLAKKLVLQVSKYGAMESKGLGWMRH